MQALPFSQACENNRIPILGVLRETLPAAGTVLEIGSGTGQHAACFAAALPALRWQTSDLPEHHAGIRQWLAASGAANAPEPITLDVCAEPWPIASADAVFSANTAHIMHWPVVEAMFAGIARVLRPGGPFLLYGPFSDCGVHHSDSNRLFDQGLRARDPGMGVRDLDALRVLAGSVGLELAADIPLPANNRILTWRHGPRS